MKSAVAIAVLSLGLVAVAGVAPTYADVLPPGGGSITAPSADGTNGSDDGPAVVSVGPSFPSSGSISAVAAGPTLCDPNSTWYTTSSTTKSGAVTNWNLHIRNDSVPEHITFSTSSTGTVTASASVTGSLTASAAIKKVAEVALGLTTNYGLSGSIAATATYSRTVDFSTPGRWVIWAGVYKGTGTVQMKKCSSNGQTVSNAGTGTASTFDKGRVTGLTNCANSVTNLVERSAKTKC